MEQSFQSYVSRGVRISQSREHEHLFIFDFSDGTFFSIASSPYIIHQTHPADVNQELKREYKQFAKTSSYKPQFTNGVSFKKLARNHGRQSKSWKTLNSIWIHST